jgi:hypothetical protein
MSETSHRGSRAAKAAEAEPEATTTETVEVGPEVTANASEEPEVVAVPVTQLVEESSDFLGVPSHTAMGALSGDLDGMMTAPEAKAKVDAWLEQPVQTEGDEEG